MLCFCLGRLHEDSYWPLCLSQHPLTGVQATAHLYKPHPTNIFISLFLSAKLRAPECSPAVQKRPLTPTTTSSTCLQTPLLDILSHPQMLTTKSSRTLSMLVLLSAPMFPICLTNVFTLELNTLLVTRLHTGPDQGYSKTQGQDERICKKTSPGGKRADPCKLKGLLPQLNLQRTHFQQSLTRNVIFSNVASHNTQDSELI